MTNQKINRTTVGPKDADIGEKQITPVCADGFKPGMGVVLRDRSKPNTLATMPLLGRSEQRLRALRNPAESVVHFNLSTLQ